MAQDRAARGAVTVRSGGAIAAILAAVLALVTLLVAGIVSACGTIVGTGDRGNLCATDRHHCFVDEHGTVASYDEATSETVVETASGTVALSQIESPPAPGTPVALQRWEGGDVAYLIDLGTGERHETSSIRGEATTGFLFCLILLLYVCRRTFVWLRGY